METVIHLNILSINDLMLNSYFIIHFPYIAM